MSSIGGNLRLVGVNIVSTVNLSWTTQEGIEPDGLYRAKKDNRSIATFAIADKPDRSTQQGSNDNI